MDVENREKKKLLRKMEAAMKEFLMNLGYLGMVQWKISEEEALTKADISYYEDVLDYIDTPEYQSSLHENALLAHVSDVVYFERSMKALFEKMCQTTGTPHYICDVSFYQLHPACQEVQELKAQISVLMEEMASVTEFANYSVQTEEVDVATVIKEREESIRGIIKKYSYMDVSDQFLQTLAILDDEDLKQVLEYELVELEERLRNEIQKITRQNKTGFDVVPAMFYPYETRIGRLLFFYHSDPKARRYVLAGLEPKEEYRERYAMFNQKNGEAPVYIREEIPELVKNMLLDAKEEIIVISPWISAGIEDSKKHKNYFKELSEAASKMPIHIYYGFDGSSTSTYQSQSSLNKEMADRRKISEDNLRGFLDKLDENARNHVWCHYGYLHIKALIVDRKQMILGSNNILSNVPRKAVHNVYEPFTQAETMMVTRDELAIGAVLRYCDGVRGRKL